MVGDSEFHYVGTELDLFLEATRWKRYWSRRMSPFVSGSVLEVGAGIGANVPYLWNRSVAAWACLEPDGRFVEEIQRRIDAGDSPRGCVGYQGTMADIPASERFNTIAYFDLLEHIEDDRGELARAAEHLAQGGRIVVLAPAHSWLYSEFDRAIGHHRRYTASRLAELTPAGTICETWFYLDSVGLLASLGNRALLKQSMPSKAQIALWDRVLVPASTIVDRLFNFTIGKSVAMIWRKRDD